MIGLIVWELLHISIILAILWGVASLQITFTRQYMVLVTRSLLGKILNSEFYLFCQQYQLTKLCQHLKESQTFYSLLVLIIQLVICIGSILFLFFLVINLLIELYERLNNLFATIVNLNQNQRFQPVVNGG